MAAMTGKDVGECNNYVKMGANIGSYLQISEDYCAFRNRCVHACASTYGLFLAVVFVRPDVQLHESGSELVEDRSQLEAILEQRHPREDVQTQSGS